MMKKVTETSKSSRPPIPKGEKRIVLSRLRVSQSEQRVLFEREKGAEFMPYMASQVLIKHIDSKQFAIDTYQ